jgi:outer membrane protein TolC
MFTTSAWAEPGGETRSSARKVTFDEAVRLATSQNPTLAAATAQRRRAESLLAQARATSMPTLSANATYTRLDDDRLVGTRVAQGKDSLNANLLLTVPIIAPSRWAQWGQAQESVDVARASVEDARRQISLATGRAYLTIIGQRKVIEVAERALVTGKAHYDFVHARLTGGVGTKLDEVRAEQEVAVAESQLASARSGLIRAQEALGVLVGEEGPVDAGDEPSLAGKTSAASLDATTRADVAALEARWRIADRRAKDGWRDYSPTLVGLVQPFYQTPATLTQPTLGWQAQLVLSIPLYDGGSRPGVNAEREALALEAKANAEAVTRQARSEVRVAREVLARAEESRDAAKRSAELAAKTLDLTNVAYKAGATSNLEVIDAERRARDAETSLAIAEDGVRQSQLELLIAGGLFP